MNRIGYILLVSLFILKGHPLLAQQEDAGLWSSFGIEKEFDKDLAVSLSQELRFNENISELGTAFTELGVSKGFGKGFKAGISYRLIQKRQVDDYYQWRHRILFDLSYRYKIQKVSLSLRQRYTRQYNQVNYDAEASIPVQYFRTRLKADYKINKKTSAFLSGELFYELQNSNNLAIDNSRYIAGIEYTYKKKHIFEISYIIDKELYVSNPLTNYVFGIGYKFLIPESKKKQMEAPVAPMGE